MGKYTSHNIVYNKMGQPTDIDLSDSDFCKKIQVLSIINVHNTKSFVSNGILFFSWLKNKFQKAISAHSQIYMGIGKNLCASADEAGFMLRRIVRQMKPAISMRIYSNWKMPVSDMEIIKGRIWDAIDEPYAWNNIWYKATNAVKSAWEYMTGHSKKVNVKDQDGQSQVCNEQVELAFMPDPNQKPFYRIIPEGVTIKDSVPTDIDRYMATDQAKKDGWYLAAQYFWKEDGELV